MTTEAEIAAEQQDGALAALLAFVFAGSLLAPAAALCLGAGWGTAVLCWLAGGWTGLGAGIWVLARHGRRPEEGQDHA